MLVLWSLPRRLLEVWRDLRIRDRQVTDLDLSGDNPETLAVINAMINAGLRFGAEGLIGPEISALEFEAGFAEQYHLSIEALR